VVLLQANEFSHGFETYSYLWLDDREFCMQQFLTYGRQLTTDELDLIALGDEMAPKPSPPNMELFREQVWVFQISNHSYTMSFNLDFHFLNDIVLSK
jgi:dynein heavy chain